MSANEDRLPVAHPEKALSPSAANHRDVIRDSDISGKDNDYGEKPEDSDLEAQEEPRLEELPGNELDRDVALSGGIEGRPLSILSRVKSRPDSVNNIKSIPNGGLRAWLQVAGAWVLFLNTWCVHTLFRRTRRSLGSWKLRPCLEWHLATRMVEFMGSRLLRLQGCCHHRML